MDFFSFANTLQSAVCASLRRGAGLVRVARRQWRLLPVLLLYSPHTPGGGPIQPQAAGSVQALTGLAVVLQLADLNIHYLGHLVLLVFYLLGRMVVNR